MICVNPIYEFVESVMILCNAERQDGFLSFFVQWEIPRISFCAGSTRSPIKGCTA